MPAQQWWALMGNRPRAEMDAVRDALVSLVFSDPYRTLRHSHYKVANTLHLVPQNDNGYDCVTRQMLGLRIAERIPWKLIIDEGRYQRRPLTFISVSEALKHRAKNYRQSVWTKLDVQPYAMLEKDALVSITEPITDSYDVPLFSLRGFCHSFLHEIAEIMRTVGRRKLHAIYYIGDYDKPGFDIDNIVRRFLIEKFGRDLDITFTRLAVTEQQIEELRLPTIPPKPKHAKAWSRRPVVEADALETEFIQALITDAIEQHLPIDHMERISRQQNLARRKLAKLASTM